MDLQADSGTRRAGIGAFVGVAMLVFALTGFCIMANSLYWMGAEPRLAPLPKESRVAAPHAMRQA